jgi:AcrR family transcriptional regulator
MTETPMDAPEKTTDRRVRRSRETVLAATSALLIERGYAGASVDEIARRSGVAKTTIYRHWPTRTDLLRDACATIGTPLEEPDTGSLKTDVLVLMTDLGQMLQTARWPSVLPSIIDAAERDPDIAEMYSTLQEAYSAPLAAVLHRAIDTGELAEGTDVSMLVAALTGPLFYRRWFSRDRLTEDFVTQIVRQIIN